MNLIKLNYINKETANDRLKIIVSELGFQVLTDFDKIVGVPINTTSRYIRRRKSEMNGEFIEKLALSFPEINWNWFLTGEEGPVFRKPQIADIEKKYKTKEQEAIKYENSFGIH